MTILGRPNVPARWRRLDEPSLLSASCATTPRTTPSWTRSWPSSSRPASSRTYVNAEGKAALRLTEQGVQVARSLALAGDDEGTLLNALLDGEG